MVAKPGSTIANMNNALVLVLERKGILTMDEVKAEFEKLEKEDEEK